MAMTPNKFRNLKKLMRDERARYQTARKLALAALRVERSSPGEYRLAAAAEDALTTCWLARKDYYQLRLIVSTAVVEVGAAWSPRGLANVQRSNRHR